MSTDKGSAARGLRGASPRVFKPIAVPDAPLINAWRTGLRTMDCLWCDRPFTSSGRQERMCPACRRHTQ